MAKLYINSDPDEEVTEIVFGVNEGEDLIFKENDVAIGIKDSQGMVVCLYKSDIPNLEKAIQKARELGWFDE